MKKTLQFLLALMVSATATLSAQDFDDGVFRYTITNATTSEVEIHSMITPTANVVIPADVVDVFAPYDVTGIGNSAFSTNTGKGAAANPANSIIETVTLPASVTILGPHAFRQLANLTTINLDNVVDVGSNCFVTNGNLSDVGSLVNVLTYGGYAFYQCHKLTSLDMPNITSIGDGGFYDMDGLKSINIPASVTTIGSLLGGRSGLLTEIQVNWASPSDVATSGERFFRGRPIATEGAITLYVPTGTKAAYEAAVPWGVDSALNEPNSFHDNNIVEGVIPPPSTDPEVGDTFTENNIDYTVTSVQPNPLEAEVSGSTMAALVIPSTATDSNKSATYSITAVGISAFFDNTTLTSVVLPASVILLQRRSFRGTTNLSSINLDNVITIEGNDSLSRTTSLFTADLASCTTISDYTFVFAGVSSVSIPVAETIGTGAFYDTALSSINIPASVTSIGDSAFKYTGTANHANAIPIADIQVNWTTSGAIPVLVAATTFLDGTNLSSITLHVPVGSSALYAAASIWQDLTIVEGTLGTSDVEKALGLKLYPNPTNGIVNIKNSNNTDLDITVYDVNGRTLLNTTNSRVDISSFSAGLYIFRVKTEKGQLVKRMLKN